MKDSTESFFERTYNCANSYAFFLYLCIASHNFASFLWVKIIDILIKHFYVYHCFYYQIYPIFSYF